MSRKRWLLVGMIALVLFGCSGIPGQEKVTMATTTNIKSTSTYQSTALYRIDDVLSYLVSQGFVYEDEMVVAGLEDGYLEGRRLRSNDVVVTIYRILPDNQDIQAAMEVAKANGVWSMAEMTDAAVFVVGDILFVGSDEGIAVIRPYFE